MKNILMVGLISFWMGAVCDAQEKFKFEKQVDALVKPYLEAKKFRAASFAVIADGQVWFGNYGQLSEADESKPTGDTVYEIGSMSKVFTSLLLADAVSAGEVKLDMAIGELLPEIQETELGKSITLKHLSTHMSGFPKMPTNIVAENPDNPFAGYDRSQLVEYLKNAKLTNEAGKKHEYSNLGAGLLGDLLSAKSGQEYEALLRERVLKPLNMNDTSVKLSDDQSKRFAPPFNSALLPDHAWDFDALVGAGGIRSTTKDMMLFMQANLNPPDNEIGKAIELAWEEHLPAGDDHRAMGLGWQFAGDGSTHWHNGQTGGYQSMMLVSRKLNAAVVCLCNTTGSEIDGLTESVFQTVVGMNPKPRTFTKEVKVDEATLQRLVGKYQLAPQIEMEIASNDGRLVAKLTGQSFLKIVPESDTVWNYTEVEAQLTFVLPKEGPATKVTLLQNGQKMPAPRIKE